MEKYTRNFEKLNKARSQFEKIMEEIETDIIRDAAIQRFEFTYELLWKTLKAFLEEYHGIRVHSPRQAFKEAYSLELIDDEELFLDMLESRNLLAHTYSESESMAIYQRFPLYLPVISAAISQLDSIT
ncbi:MAG: HI0074 family nucleotidyltransferase substrate-binding subunit [Bacteroidota bacterium]|nr:HI0074 family nucleotidyltransferase substrate-binding subunit [Bacteroidota bacterium]